MNLKDSILGFFSSKATQNNNNNPKMSKAGFETYSAGTWELNNASSKTREYLSQLEGWVSAAVTAIADEVATIDIKLYEMKKNEVTEVKDHPALSALYKINGFTTKFDHFWLTQTFLELTGESPWFLDRSADGVNAIYLLRPDKFSSVTDKNSSIDSYKYEISPGKNITLAKEDVVFLKYPDPSHPFRGKGTLAMSARTVDIDNFSEEWNKQFYQNAARPDSVLTINSEQLDEEQKDVLKKSLREQYEGTKNAHKVMVLFGDMKFDKTGFSMKDMDFLEQQKFSRDKILGIFRVPKAIVAQTEGVNLASAQTAQYVFTRHTIKPKMERLIQQLNEFYLPLFKGTENMFLDYINPVQDDVAAKSEEYTAGLKWGWFTINEVREDQGLPPVSGGDVIYINSSETPLATSASNAKKQPTPSKTIELRSTGKGVIRKNKFSTDRLNEVRVRAKNIIKIEKEEEQVKKIIKKALLKEYYKGSIKTKTAKNEQGDETIQRVLSEKEIREFWKVKNGIFHKYLKLVKNDIVKVFALQRKEVLTKLSKKKSVLTKVISNDLYQNIKLNENKSIDTVTKLTMPVLIKLFQDSANETFQMLQTEDTINMSREEIKKLINSKARIFATSLVKTTNDNIKQQVIEGLASAESIPQIKERIVSVFKKAEEYRAERIARTETLRYNTAATEQAFKDSEIVEGKVWVVDGNPCEYCLALNGKTAPLGGDFIKKGGTVLDRVFDYDNLPSPPLHPNCECDLVPIFKSVKVIKNV